MHLCIFTKPNLFESVYMSEPLISLDQIILWPISFPQNTEWKGFQSYHVDFLLPRSYWSNLIKSNIDTSRLEPWQFVV
jgi:hypothetical protein